MAPNPQKFLFDHVFDQPAAAVHGDEGGEMDGSVVTCSLDEWDAHHAAGYETGYKEGYEQGKAHALNSIEGQIHDLILTIGRRSDDFFAHQESQDAAIKLGVQNLFSLMVDRFFPLFARSGGLDEINGVISDTLNKLKNKSLTIFVSPDLKDPVAQRFENHSIIRVESDDTLGPSDVRIDWDSGSINRRLDGVCQALKALIDTRR